MIPIRIADFPRWLRDGVPLVLVMGTIYYLSSQSRLIDFEEGVGDVAFYKSAHFIAYAILAWLWWRALTAKRRLTWGLLGSAFVLTGLYGVSDEVHQLYVPGRHGQIFDVMVDLSGAFVMLLALRRVSWLRKFPENVTLFSTKNEGNPSQTVS